MPDRADSVTRTGHPYLTQELDERRSAQRRLLSRIPDPWLRQVLQEKDDYDPSAGITDLVNPHRLEYDLRTLVANEFADVVKWAEAELTALFLPDDVQRFLRDRFDDASYFLLDAARNVAFEPPVVSVEFKSRIRIVVALLMWADELADDGYHDPRIN